MTPKFKVSDELVSIYTGAMEYYITGIDEAERIYHLSYNSKTSGKVLTAQASFEYLEENYIVKSSQQTTESAQCDCGGFKTYNSMDQQYHSTWCKSRGGKQ